MRLTIWRLFAAAWPLLLHLSAAVHADPTWPSPHDELEEIMYQLFAFRGRRFADTISPCTNEASGPGRQNAAEWLRLGFHDMSTADALAGKGGLDSSIQYMLDNGENLGPGFNSTLKFMSNYLSERTSISDLIAAGVYASVRSCGGPVVPVRAGRIDAVGPGATGVPQPQHEIDLFRSQFQRMGFSPQEMIEVTACGHTLGGVHGSEFPELITQSEVGTDGTVADFDNKIVTEYLEGNTTNPLVVGPAVELGKDSDRRIFMSDGNKTVKAMTDPAAFNAACQRILQKMIDTVPKEVVLSDPIQPYFVKPVNLQLTLDESGDRFLFKGHIRVRTTDLPKEQINTVTLVYKNRSGGNDCGRESCSIVMHLRGASHGFDDTFSFFPIEKYVTAHTGISSFTLTLNLKNGTKLAIDNNGQSYPIQDAVMLQQPQSCLIQHSGVFTAVAAVRNDRIYLPVTLSVSYKAPRPGLAVAALYEKVLPMQKGQCAGMYTLYTTNWTIPGGISFYSKWDVISGDDKDMVVDDWNEAIEVGGRCDSFRNLPAEKCSTLAPATPTPQTTVTSVYDEKPSTMMTQTSSAAAPTVTPSPVPDTTVELPEPVTKDHSVHLGRAFVNFVDYLVNYIANFFFGYDRFQLVNHDLGRVT